MNFIQNMLTIRKKENPTIGAFYQCYKQPKALIHALQHFRKIYPNSTVVLVSNNGDNMENVARFFNCNYTHSFQSNSNHSVYFSDEAGVKLYVKRIYEAAQKIKEDYIILLADDVHVFKPITNLKYDLNGGEGYWRGRLKRRLKNFFRKNKIVYSKYDDMRAFGDGFIMRKKFILEHFNNIEEPLKQFSSSIKKRYNNLMPSDVCINTFTVYFGGSVGPYFGWYEQTRLFYWPRKLLNSIQVSHQEKSLYDQPLSQEEKSILEGK
ncbi:MAG: hypothetical protein WAV15_03005 [Minisyncoccia bacterium]